jgi:hypothetical protein
MMNFVCFKMVTGFKTHEVLKGHMRPRKSEKVPIFIIFLKTVNIDINGWFFQGLSLMYKILASLKKTEIFLNIKHSILTTMSRFNVFRL